MKNIILLFAALLCITTQIGYAQNSKEEAIVIIGENRFVEILRDPENQEHNISLFISEVKKIMPLDEQESSLLKGELLEATQHKEVYSRDALLGYWASGRPPRIGSNTDAVLRDYFNDNEYERLSKQLSENMIATVSAYEYLLELYKFEIGKGEHVVMSFPDIPGTIDHVLKYFGI